jgi:hypothetical protein
MNERELIAAIDQLQKMTDAEREEWLRNNSTRLDQDQAERLMLVFPNTRFAGMANDIAQNRYDGLVETVQRQEIQGIADQARETALASGASAYVAEQAAKEAVVAAGGDPGSVSSNSQFLLSQKAEAAVGWNTDDPKSYERALNALQELFPDAKDFDDALDKGYLADPLTQKVLSVAVQPEDNPDQLRGIGIKGNGYNVFIPNTIATQAVEQFGISESALVKSVKQAEAWGFQTAAGEVAWQPYLALQKAYGTNVEPGNRTAMLAELIPRRAELEKKIKKMESTGRGSAPAYADAKRELADIERRLAADRRTGAASLTGQRQLMQSWKEGMKLYDSETLAFFHALNPGLASRMKNTQVLDLGDARMALSLMAKAGLSGDNPEDFAVNMAQLGFLDPYAKALVDAQQKAASAGAGGSGRTVLKPDSVAIRQATKDMYRSLYLEDPSEGDLNAMAARVESAIVSAPDDVSVSGEARIRDVVEGDPKYQQYYGKKPGGMSEEEYQGMHRAAQGSMLGEELADNQAVRLGMQEGQYQTTVGATMGTKEAWDNSTFMGRLARAAQTVGRNT